MSSLTIAHAATRQTLIDVISQRHRCPAAVLLVGGNAEHKRALSAPIFNDTSVYVSYRAINSAQDIPGDLAAFLKQTDVTIFDFVGTANGDPHLRPKLLEQLKEAGVQMTVIIWVQRSKNDDETAHLANEMLRHDPPTDREADYLFTYEP